MDTESSQNWPQVEPRTLLPTRRRRWPLVLVVLVFALAGATGAYAWLNPGLIIPFTSHKAADTDIGSSDKAVLTDLIATQQKTTDDLASIDRTIADQQEQPKAIVGQIASLSSKIDAMKSPAPDAPIPPASPSPAAAPLPAPANAAPVTTPHAASKQKKPPRAVNPTGPISVGGAPLSTAPGVVAR